MRYERNRAMDEFENTEKIMKLKRWTPVVAVIVFVTTWNPFLVLIICAISKALRKSLEDSNTFSGSRLRRKNVEQINAYLEQVFAMKDELELTADVKLKPDGRFINADSCSLYFGDEKVGRLKELNAYYPEAYANLFHLLQDMAENKEYQSNEKEKQKEEPVVLNQNKPSVSKTQEYIDIINGLNDDIPNEEISNGLYMTCSMLSQIALIQDKFPDTEEKIHKLYQYYLPILIEILKKYSDLQHSHHSSMQELKDAEVKLNKTILLINEALKTMTSTLCQDEFMDLNANMSTLENILKSDGLVEEGTLRSVQKGKG